MAEDAAAEEIEEIIVTAQLRSQSLQDVPIAMQVVDRQLIEDVAAEDMGDLNGFVPGLVVSGDSPTQPRYQIRGIQTGDFGVGTDPAVGVYVDGIYAARSGASMTAFNDIERIEVLKGPQGTLFGRNSAAGAISIVTAQPSHEFDSLLRVRVGEFGKQYFEGMINTPIGEHFAVRANGVFNKSDGWMQDAATGADLNPEENWAGRVAMRWDLSDATSATLSFDHDNLDQLARPAIGLVGNQVRSLSGRPGDVCRSPQGPYLQRCSRQRGIAQARPGEPVHRPFVWLGGLPIEHFVAPVRNREPGRRRRHEPDQHVLRHRQFRE
jgi:iron complex outermembrane receptor protein